MKPTPSPTTDTGIDWGDPEAIFEILFFRVTSSDDEWLNDPASLQWSLSREEAARRLDIEDYGSPF